MSQVLPQELRSRAKELDRARFLAFARTWGFLLIKLDELGGELAQGLLESGKDRTEALPPSNSPLGFGTCVQDTGKMGGAERKAVVPLDVVRLRTLLVKANYFASPLVKRVIAGKPFADRISVGRARNNDIVLRDQSVSKFHAWFEYGEDENFYLRDARSTNATSLNGVRVSRDLELVKPGSEIAFGGVTCILCEGAMLWEVLNKDASHTLG